MTTKVSLKRICRNEKVFATATTATTTTVATTTVMERRCDNGFGREVQIIKVGTRDV